MRHKIQVLNGAQKCSDIVMGRNLKAVVHEVP